MSLDFSATAELRPLATVVADLRPALSELGIECLLVGATARDIRLRHEHNIERLRATADVDIAIAVADWGAFHQLRTNLLATRNFRPRDETPTHKLRHRDGLPLDIVPFGGIEGPDRTIAWPPEEMEILDCFGLKEALGSSQEVRLPMDMAIRVPSIPALTLLKITAWRDRQDTYPGKDAPDLLQYLRNYTDCGNLDRILDDHQDLLDRPDYDHDEAGVRLLARDVGRLIHSEARERVLDILIQEADEEGSLKLARQSGMELNRARRLLEVFVDEFAAFPALGR